MRHPIAARRRSLALGIALLSAAPSTLGFASVASLLSVPATAQSGSEKEKKPKWPSLSKADRKTAERAYQSIREADKAEHPEDQIAEGEATLGKLGPAVVPWAFGKLKGRKVQAPESLVRVLEAVVEPDYAPLVADELTARRTGEWTRRWAALWIARRVDPEFQKAMEAQRDHKDPIVAFRCAVGLLALGDLGGFDLVFAGARDDWAASEALFAVTLPKARGDEAFDKVRPQLTAKKELDQIAALRLSRFLAPKPAGVILATSLDSDQFAVKKEAINALRMVVDGEPALSDDELTVFKINDEATKWKKRFQ